MSRVIGIEDHLRRRLKKLSREYGPEATKFFTQKQLDILAGKAESK